MSSSGPHKAARRGAIAVLVLAAACTTAGEEAAPSPTPAAAPTGPAAAATVAPTASPPAATSEPAPASSAPAVTTTRGFREWDVQPGDHPHDVAPARDGRVWYTAQHAEALGLLDPTTGESLRVPLGSGSAPHGVIVGPDGDAWVTDGGLNAILRIDAETLTVETHPLPGVAAGLNTAAFDGDGVLWFTGNAGFYGRVDPTTGTVDVFEAPRGPGPYGIAATGDGTVWFSSLAGSYIARVNRDDGSVEVVDVPTPGGGARRVWGDSAGRLWVTEWHAGNLARYDPADGSWREWRLPGAAPQPYAVYVDERDTVWVTDFGADALVAFDPATERFESHPFPTAGAEVRQLLGRDGEVWGAGSGVDTLILMRTGG